MARRGFSETNSFVIFEDETPPPNADPAEQSLSEGVGPRLVRQRPEYKR
jgi:hypothetical protein